MWYYTYITICSLSGEVVYGQAWSWTLTGATRNRINWLYYVDSHMKTCISALIKAWWSSSPSLIFTDLYRHNVEHIQCQFLERHIPDCNMSNSQHMYTTQQRKCAMPYLLQPSFCKVCYHKQLIILYVFYISLCTCMCECLCGQNMLFGVYCLLVEF